MTLNVGCKNCRTRCLVELKPNQEHPDLCIDCETDSPAKLNPDETQTLLLLMRLEPAVRVRT